jgi:hypothetical protein
MKVMKAQTKLAIGLVAAIITVLIASQSTIYTTGNQKVKQDRIKIKRSEDAEKAKLKTKNGTTRDLSTGSENTK